MTWAKCFFPVFCLAGALLSGPSALAAPALKETALYTKKARDCHAVDLATWSHPTLAVLKKADVTLKQVEFCNNKTYPVFTVEFKYDPHGPTDSYFNPLYARMAEANGFWPFSFVDVTDAVILNIGVEKKRNILVDYEEYETAAGRRTPGP